MVLQYSSSQNRFGFFERLKKFTSANGGSLSTRRWIGEKRMSSLSAEDDYLWYVICTHPRQEDRAESNLNAWNVETFAPRIKKKRYNQFTGAAIQLVKPLFPRYIFAILKLSEMLQKARYTRGVHSVVGFGAGPSPVDEVIIKIIRSRIGDDGFIQLGERLKVGDAVMIKDGSLRNFTGIFERDIKESDRVMILLNTISFQGHLQIDRDLVR